jgi:hypothetical protein
LWSTDAYNQLQLAAFPNNPSCITTRSKSIFIDACARIDDSDSSTQDPAKSFTFVDDESGKWIKQTKSIRGSEAPTSSAADLYIGINPEQRYARVHLYRKQVTNGSLNKWKVVHGFASVISPNRPSVIPSSDPTQAPSVVLSMVPTTPVLSTFPSLLPSKQPSSPEEPTLLSVAIDILGSCASSSTPCNEYGRNKALQWFTDSTNHPDNYINTSNKIWLVS